MKTFTEFLTESEDKISIKKATLADRKKGESYVVYDVNTKNIVQYSSKWMHMLKRETAVAVAKTNDDWKVADGAWASDKGIKIPSK